jgi:hypothetical protein
MKYLENKFFIEIFITYLYILDVINKIIHKKNTYIKNNTQCYNYEM